jgi:tRNA threonylcarbamoyladenosine biosynthesis protein TsaB
MADSLLLLGIDTCGPMGSVALASLIAGDVEALGELELAGRSYSATLVASVSELLTQAGEKLAQVGGIVVVNGPGSFTGVRIGVSAVKALAEAVKIPVVAISRLEVLAKKAGVGSSALDAHRHEVFLSVARKDAARELLAGSADFETLGLQTTPMAICDDAAAALLHSAWPDAEQVRVAPPTAMDALRVAAPRVLEKAFVDVALLDGHYLRRSDAEILSNPETATAQA